MSIRTKHANFTLANADLLACDAALATVLERIAALPETETALVKHLAKIGNKSESFAREAHALGKQHEGLLPRDMDLETLERALRNRDALRERLIAVRHLAERLEAAIVLLGVDSYRDGLDIYHALKRGGTTQALREAVKELGRTFRKSPTKPKAPVPPESDTGNPADQSSAPSEDTGESKRVQPPVERAMFPEGPRLPRIPASLSLAPRFTWDASGRAGWGEVCDACVSMPIVTMSPALAGGFGWDAFGS